MRERTARSRSLSSSSAEPRWPPTRTLTTSGSKAVPPPHALHGVHELGHVAHPVLEEVADPGGVVADELEQIRRLEVLGEHEHGDPGWERLISVAATSPSSAFPGGIRTSTIAISGVYEPHLQEKVVRVGAAPDDLVAGLLEQRRDPLPEKRIVVGDDHAERSRAPFPRLVPGCSVSDGMTGTERHQEIASQPDLERVQHEVARILAETDVPVEVYASTLEKIGLSFGWEFGAVWEAGHADGLLRCVQTWHTAAGAPEFEARSQEIELRPGEGLPGRVLSSGESIWMADAPTDGNFPRAVRPAGPACTLRSAFRCRAPTGSSA